MLDLIFEEIKTELESSQKQKKHPFKYCTLATVAEEHPRLRTVVLRDHSEDLSLYFFTDSRSIKISHLRANPLASVLFYHPKKMLQLTVNGKISILTEGSVVKNYWNRVQGRSKNDYTTLKPPGTVIDNPDHVEYDYQEPYFAVLQMKLDKIEYLKLKRPNHIRALFKRDEEKWTQTFLNP